MTRANDTRYEEVTQFITLTDPDTYKGTMTYDLLHAADDTPIAQGCSVNIDTVKRLE